MTLRLSSAGESHGPALVAIVSGLPAGLMLDQQAIDADLKRRQEGYGRSPRKNAPKWSCIAGITREGARIPGAANHIKYPSTPKLLYGCSPLEAGRLAAERADQAYDHGRRRRRLRRDGIALLAGVFVASPVILYQLWLFIAPGLYRHERKWVWPFVFLSVLFFVGGGYFGYAVGFPMVAKFLVATGEDFMPVLKIEDYLDITSKLLLGMGLVFETPILIFFLARMGVVTEKWLLAKFRYAVLIIFIIAALITPTPDIPTQCAFALPMCALYLLGVLMAWVFKKKKPKKA